MLSRTDLHHAFGAIQRFIEDRDAPYEEFFIESVPASPGGSIVLSVAKRFDGRLRNGMRIARDLSDDASSCSSP